MIKPSGQSPSADEARSPLRSANESKDDAAARGAGRASDIAGQSAWSNERALLMAMINQVPDYLR
jgi:hypothetical protein